MMKTKIASALALLALLVTPISAHAATESISVSEQFNPGVGCADTVRFDPSGRMWVSNIEISTPDTCPPLQKKVWKRSPSGWVEDTSVSLESLKLRMFDFGNDGTLYGNARKRGQIRVVSFNEDGSVKSSRILSLKRKVVPIAIATSSANRLYVMSSGRIEEYRLPLKKKSSKNKPIRTLNGNWGAWSTYPVLAAGADGTIFAVEDTQDVQAPVLVYGPSRKGSESADRSIVIDTALSTQGLVSELSVTPSGDLAVLYFSWGSDAGVAIYDDSANGASVTPATWYPMSGARDSFDISSTGKIAVTLRSFDLPGASVVTYLDSFCALRPEARC